MGRCGSGLRVLWTGAAGPVASRRARLPVRRAHTPPCGRRLARRPLAPAPDREMPPDPPPRRGPARRPRGCAGPSSESRSAKRFTASACPLLPSMRAAARRRHGFRSPRDSASRARARGSVTRWLSASRTHSSPTSSSSSPSPCPSQFQLFPTERTASRQTIGSLAARAARKRATPAESGPVPGSSKPVHGSGSSYSS